MRKAFNVTLVLPDHIDMYYFIDIINSAMDKADFNYEVDREYMPPYNVKTTIINTKEHELDIVNKVGSVGSDVTLIEFKRKENASND